MTNELILTLWLVQCGILTSMSTRRLKIYSTATIAVSLLVFCRRGAVTMPGLSPDRMKASVSAYQSVRGTSSTSQNTPQITYARALRASARGTGEASYIVSGASEPG